jgi:ABC-type glycerol-3-phosphate transport system permease component
MSEPDYAAAWRDLRGRRVLLWVLFLGFIPGHAVLCFGYHGRMAGW